MPDLHKQVKKTIFKQHLFNDGDLVIVAVSGGADSLSLLYVLNEIRLEKPGSFLLYVAHLNHGLRGKQARDDASFVRQEAKNLGLPFTIGAADTLTFAGRHRLSLEDAARRLRYRFLERLAQRLGAAAIAVGHNRDDQVETLLLNFLRGTGLDGLSGMKFKRATGVKACTLIRPLLETGRNEIEKYCRQKGLLPRLDQTNQDIRFLRNKVRLVLLPTLEKDYNPNIRKNLAQLSALLEWDRDFLQKAAGQHLAQIISREGAAFLELDLAGLGRAHAAMQGRILRQAICRLVGTVPREVGYRHISQVLKLCREGSPHGTLHLPLGLKVSRDYQFLCISCGKQQRPGTGIFKPFYLPVPGEKAIPGDPTVSGRGSFIKAALASPKELAWPVNWQKEAYLDYERVQALARGGEKLPAFAVPFCAVKKTGTGPGAGEKLPVNGDAALCLLVRTRQKGDLFYPLGAPGQKKLKKYFIDQKVPLQARAQIPLVLAGSEIIWVCGRQISHRCRITEQTKKALVLQIV